MSNYEVRNHDDLKLWFRIKSIEKKIDKLGPMYLKDLIGWSGKVLRRFGNLCFTAVNSQGYY